MEPAEKELEKINRRNKIAKVLIIILSACLLLGAGFWIGSAGIRLLPQSQSRAESEKLEEISEVLEKNWYYANQVKDIDEALIALGVNGMASQVDDEFTSYLTNEGVSIFDEKLLASNKGLGLGYTQREDGFYIKEIYLNSPAEKAGLARGDKLISVDNQAFNEDLVEKLPELVQSKDKISLTIERNGEPITVEITPESYDSSLAIDIQPEEDYALITLKSFSKNTAAELKKALERITSQKINNLIIDVRDNTGGYLTTAMAVLNLFLEDDLVLFYDSYADGTKEEYRSGQGNEPFTFENIYILQNGESASASEMFIAAMQYYLPQVTTIGQTSYGKGSVQDRYTFEDGTAIKYTRSLWLTPEEISINNEGIAPEIEIETPLKDIALYSNVEEVSTQTNSPNTKAVQQLLDYLGYEIDNTDGYFTEQSAQALRQFQEEEGLEATGKSDEETLQRLAEKASDKIALVEPDLALEKAISIIMSNEANETGSQTDEPSQNGQDLVEESSIVEESLPESEQ